MESSHLVIRNHIGNQKPTPFYLKAVMLIWLMNFTEEKVTPTHWCIHSVSLAPCIVPVAQCLCVYNPLQIESLRAGTMSHLPLSSYRWAKCLVPSGNWISACLTMLNVFGSFSEMIHFLSLLISQKDNSQEMTKVFFQRFDLYYAIKKRTGQMCVGRPGAHAKVMCVLRGALFP